MFFNARLEIDPTQMTLIKKVKPAQLFSKFMHFLSLGQLSEKQEHETFTAIAILQQLNMGLRSVKVKNIIRLAVDDYDFYKDDKGMEDDLEQAMFEFKAKVDPLESELYQKIFMVLEHIDESIKYLIEISVKRTHKVGEYPIRININGVLADFELKENMSPEQLNEKMEKVFSSQRSYNEYLASKKALFTLFVDELEDAILKFIRVDDIIKKINLQIIRPSKKIEKLAEVKHEKYAAPVYYGYYNFDRYFFYTWIWAGLLHEHNLYCNDLYLVDEKGRDIFYVGREGFYAGETNTLNPVEEFEPPKTGDISYFYDHDYHKALENVSIVDDTEPNIILNDKSWDKKEDELKGSCSACGSCSND